MVLSDVKHYLQEQRRATLQDLALHFDMAPEAMRGMVDLLIRKGRVSRCDLRASCGSGCSGCTCGNASLELYEWHA